MCASATVGTVVMARTTYTSKCETAALTMYISLFHRGPVLIVIVALTKQELKLPSNMKFSPKIYFANFASFFFS